MRPSYPRSKPPPPKPPVNSAEGGKRIQAMAVQMFDRKDGTGADWRLLTESLFRAAFDQLDKLPEAERNPIAAKVHAGAYERFLATEAARTGDTSGPAPHGVTP